MKKASRGLVALIGLSLALTGCGTNTDTDDSPTPETPAGQESTEPDTTESGDTETSEDSPEGGDYGGVTELSIYSQFNRGTPLGTVQEEVLAQFTEETGIEVTVADAVGDNAMEAYEAQVAAGQEADLVIINPTNRARDWVKNGAVVAADQYLEDWGLDERLTENALEGWRDDEGNLLGFPYVGFEWPVYWNMDVLNEAGIDEVPQTADDMYAAAEALGDTPLFVAGGGDWTGQALFFHVISAYADPDEMKEVWRSGGYCSSEPVMQGIEYFVEMRDNGVFIDDVAGYMQDQQNQTFFTGGAAAMSGGSWWFEDVPEEMRDSIQLGGVPVPDGAHYSKPLAVQGSTSGGFWISPNGEEKLEAIRALIEMFYSQDVASKVVSDTSTVTVVALDPAPEVNNPLLAQALELGDRVDYIPMLDFEIPPAVQAQNPGTTAQVYSPDITAQQICESIDSLYN